MKQNLTELVFIIDRSGSMAGLEVDTIGGFNGMLQKQKKAEGEVLVTTVLFNHESQTIHDRVEIDKVPLLTENDYCVGGCTALLDAVGETVEHIKISTNTRGRKMCRSIRCLLLQRTAWKTPALNTAVCRLNV